LIHEATVHQTDEIYLAVLFGGQKFRTFHFTITDEMKVDHIKALAEVWGHVQAGTLPEADTVENSKLIYPRSIDEAAMASQSVEKAVEALKNYKSKITALEAEMEQIEVAVRNYMADKGTLMTVDGRTLVTWKNTKPSMKFDAKLFQQSMPDLYEKYMVETMGSRRFLIK
jgi:predicted phage-related endonuclease